MFATNSQNTFSRTPADKNGGRLDWRTIRPRQGFRSGIGAVVLSIIIALKSLRRVSFASSLSGRWSVPAGLVSNFFRGVVSPNGARKATGDGLNSRRRSASFGQPTRRAKHSGRLLFLCCWLARWLPVIWEPPDCRQFLFQTWQNRILPRLRDLALVGATVTLWASSSPQARRVPLRGLLMRAAIEPDSPLGCFF